MCRSKSCMSAKTRQKPSRLQKRSCWRGKWRKWRQNSSLETGCQQESKVLFLFLFLAIFTILLSDQVEGYFGYSREQWLLYAPRVRLFQSIPSHTSQPAPASHSVTPAESDELAGNRRLMDWRWGRSVYHRPSLRCCMRKYIRNRI